MPRVLKSLQESLQVVEDRCLSLRIRLDDPDVTASIQRKVARPCSEFDQILAQFGEGMDCETHTEMFSRKLKEWESKWADIQAKFHQIKPGLNLEQEYLGLKKEVVGLPTEQLVHKNTIIDVDVNQQKSFKEIKEEGLNFEKAACISVDGALYAFLNDPESNEIKVKKLENFKGDEKISIT